jgi:hypothetical protein
LWSGYWDGQLAGSTIAKRSMSTPTLWDRIPRS